MNRFSINLCTRVILLAMTIVAGAWLFFGYSRILAYLCIPLVAGQMYGIYHYLNRINRKLTLFLESIRYQDFSIRFSSDNKLGKSFQQLNQQFNEVLEAFRQTRAEKEANLKYIDAIIQHISIGVISFDAAGRIELINPAAFRLLNIYRLRNLSELKTSHPGLDELLLQLPSGNKSLYATKQQQQLSIHATALRLQGRLIKLISIQNIHAELQKKELDAWQNLTKILRHEIMNSVTPIVSLIGTMQEIVAVDIAPGASNAEGIADLQEALDTVESRSKGIMNFVNAYRDYTALPQPQFTVVNIRSLVTAVANLFQADLKQAGIHFSLEINIQQTEIHADTSQLQMVLINLVKNAMDALEHTPNPAISMRVYQPGTGVLHIEVTDNGPGIDEEAMEKIFIPFFTTKKKGSGIGLSLSQQIIQLHGGQLRAGSPSANGNGSTFFIILNI
ncbi:ATP-binding protein [Chitinophaga sp. CB10]|uniref:sensor histidine kinase n=1 Tax=Chitinophaga sp. CB10 TaxID=1891659 RepID=UPI000AC92784|nr:ATP-binding protein [Chitinophaga sp. CB10]